jgi:hypothetical protein
MEKIVLKKKVKYMKNERKRLRLSGPRITRVWPSQEGSPVPSVVLALVSGGECLSPPPREVGNCLRALLKYIRFDSISYCPSPSPIESGKTLLSFNKL